MATVNLLEYLRSRTQVDIDTYDAEASREIGPFQDATGNQFEIQAEIVKPNRSAVLKRSLELAATIHPRFATITLEELAVEVVGIELALEVIQTVHGNVHVMVNPSYSYNTEAIVANAQRLHHICKIVDPYFDTSHLVTKVPATWEGMQASRQLKQSGIKTLATTVFSMEQVILAGEAGCISISPFVHELKTETYKGYKDKNPILGVCVQAQQFYQQNSLPTRLKVCVTMNLDELIMLAGIDALTITPKVLKVLAATERLQEEVESMSLFAKTTMTTEVVKYLSYIDSESQYRVHFAASEDGKAQFKTAQAISLFCDAQTAAELYIASQLEDSSYIPINL
ncbi:Aldolase-type TIM barrel [Penicillium hordei]|uniref:Aldolase-type TIM barrel n=1 Tax=Penicillium hordei TaxID=40994 RepID=A0AAD6EBZ0_9EURO|nr:Aldolase-type TIM barrel [Penicillium hordei]KAJ5608180.1 Aldolase-type TIM barrel [Penicillium hordei]